MPSSSAVHTTDCILHPAARIDFEQHVRLLWEAGRKDEAETLWNSVVEVQHQPAPRAPILHGTDLPAMAAVPCTEPECERCANRRGGFRFPWIGIWCKNGVLVRHGVPPQTAWTHWSQSTGHLDLLQLQMHGSGLSRANLVPETWIKVVARASLKPGCATHEEVLVRWRDWQLGSETWMDPMTFLRRPSREEALMNVHRKAQRALLDWQASDPAYCLPCSCRSCGQATRNICHYCLVGVCQECDNNTRHNSALSMLCRNGWIRSCKIFGIGMAFSTEQYRARSFRGSCVAGWITFAIYMCVLFWPQARKACRRT